MVHSNFIISNIFYDENYVKHERRLRLSSGKCAGDANQNKMKTCLQAEDLKEIGKVNYDKMALEEKLVGCRARFFLCKFLITFGYNKVAFLCF